MPRPSLITDEIGLAVLAEMDRTGQSLRATARAMELSEDAVWRWKKGYDRRVAAGEIQPYRPNFRADLDALIDQIERTLAQVKALRNHL